MKTFVPKKDDIKRSWYLIDAKDKVLGKLATQIATILRGKNKPIYAPHMDCGDYVVIINAQEIILTGNKTDNKKYYRHSRYPGGLKEQTVDDMLSKHPERVLEKAIAGMIPHNKLKKDILKKLKIYPGAEHQHEAQQPKPFEI